MQPDDLAAVRSILPKPEELVALHEAKAAAAASSSSGSGSGKHDATDKAATVDSAPRLGVVEAAFEALGGVQQLQAKIGAREFRFAEDTLKM